MENITFRPAKPEDADTLFKVKTAAYGDEFKLFNYDDVDDCYADDPKEDGMFSRKWHESFCNGHIGDWSIVIKAGSKIIGHIVAYPGQDQFFKDAYSEYDMTGNVNVIFCIYVLPEFKNRGIGEKAMDYMERLHPADKWILDTPEISQKNKHFYEKCGYTQGRSGSTNVYAKGF